MSEQRFCAGVHANFFARHEAMQILSTSAAATKPGNTRNRVAQAMRKPEANGLSRFMQQMQNDINLVTLPKLYPKDTPKVTCATCHRGYNEPPPGDYLAPELGKPGAPIPKPPPAGRGGPPPAGARTPTR